MFTKYFNTEEGRIPHVSVDGIRFYPRWMVEEFAMQHDSSMEDVLEYLGEGDGRYQETAIGERIDAGASEAQASERCGGRDGCPD